MRRLLPLAVAGALLAASLPDAASAQDGDDGTLYVTAGAVHDGLGGVHRPGAVAIRGGKIVGVGAPGDVAVPPGAERVDAGDGAVIVPGLVAAWSEHLASGGNDPASVAADVRAIDGYDFLADETRMLAGGVTTVMLSPGSTQVVSGRTAVVKLAGASRDTRLLRDDAGLAAGVGDGVQKPPARIDPPDLPDAALDPLLPHIRQLPVTRAGSLLLLRRLLATDSRRDPMWISARTAGDLEATLAFVTESGVSATLVGGLESHAVVDDLRASGLSVVLQWPGLPGRVTASDDPEQEAARLRARRNPALLADAGVPFALTTEREDALHDLLFVAASAARSGLGASAALAAVTSTPARLLGVESRVGSLVAGRDGDLVVLSGPPTDLRSVALRTVVDGRVVWTRRAGGATTVVRAAEVHLGDGRVLSPGEVAFENGKIVEVGPTVGTPPGARVIDLGAGAVMPGMIDAFTHAGLAGAGGNVGADLTTATTAAKAADSGDPAFALLAGQGVTTILAAPGGGGRVAGRASVLKTAGAWPGRRVLREDAGLVVRLRDEADLKGAADQLTAAIKKARSYRDGFKKYEKELKEYTAWKKTYDAEQAKKAAAKEKEEAEKKKEAEKKDDPKAADGDAKKDEKRKDEKKPEEKKPAEKKPAEKKPTEKKTEPRKPKKDAAMEGWAAVLDGKAPLYVQAASVAEIRAALRTLVDEAKLQVVIVGGDQSRRLQKALRKAKVGVVASPRALTTERGRDVNLLREIALSGLPAAVGSDAYLGGAELSDVVAYAVGRGLSPAAAVRLLTGDAAKLLGVDSRVGTIAAGKDADLVLLTAPPFAAGSGVRAVFVGGEEVGTDAR